MTKTLIIVVLAGASMLALSGCNKQPSTATANDGMNSSSPVAAGTGIDGTWKADINSVQFDQKPDEYLLQAGQYSCKSCVPMIAVAADGAFHPVSTPYADSYAVKMVDDHNIIRTMKKGGRQVGESKLMVSADGNTLTQSFTDTSVANAPAGKGEVTETRVAPAPAGAHVVSGQWKPTKLANFNAEALTITLKADGDMFHMNTPTGQSYDAKLGGPDVPIKGDNAGTTASVKKLADGSYQETDKRGGKVVGVATFSTGADGKLNVVGEDKTNGSTTKWTATRS